MHIVWLRVEVKGERNMKETYSRERNRPIVGVQIVFGKISEVQQCPYCLYVNIITNNS